MSNSLLLNAFEKATLIKNLKKFNVFECTHLTTRFNKVSYILFYKYKSSFFAVECDFSLTGNPSSRPSFEDFVNNCDTRISKELKGLEVNLFINASNNDNKEQDIVEIALDYLIGQLYIYSKLNFTPWRFDFEGCTLARELCVRHAFKCTKPEEIINLVLDEMNLSEEIVLSNISKKVIEEVL